MESNEKFAVVPDEPEPIVQQPLPKLDGRLTKPAQVYPLVLASEKGETGAPSWVKHTLLIVAVPLVDGVATATTVCRPDTVEPSDVDHRTDGPSLVTTFCSRDAPAVEVRPRAAVRMSLGSGPIVYKSLMRVSGSSKFVNTKFWRS